MQQEYAAQLRKHELTPKEVIHWLNRPRVAAIAERIGVEWQGVKQYKLNVATVALILLLDAGWHCGGCPQHEGQPCSRSCPHNLSQTFRRVEQPIRAAGFLGTTDALRQFATKSPDGLAVVAKWRAESKDSAREEQAILGELDARLASVGLRRVPMPADGNCFFHAAEHQLQQLQGEAADHQQLRNNFVLSWVLPFFRDNPDLEGQWYAQGNTVTPEMAALELLHDGVWNNGLADLFIFFLSTQAQRPVILWQPNDLRGGMTSNEHGNNIGGNHALELIHRQMAIDGSPPPVVLVRLGDHFESTEPLPQAAAGAAAATGSGAGPGPGSRRGDQSGRNVSARLH